MKTSILLLNLGGPETLDEVRPFLFRLFRDPDIIPLPRWLRWLSWPIAWLIAKFRAPKSREAYAAIGGGSPLRRTNDAVAAKLIDRLRSDDIAGEISVAMRYWHPLTDAALDPLQHAGTERLVVVPMYPQYSTTTTMSSYRVLHRELGKRSGWRPQLVPVLSYADDPGYLDCVRRRLKSELERVPGGVSGLTVLFSAHSIPTDRVREDGDPYPAEIEAMVATLSADLPDGVQSVLAYQSKVGPVEWVGPAVPDVIAQLAADGCRAIVVVPVSFVSEHVETLEEIDIEYAHLAKELGIEWFSRVPTVNADDDFIEFLDSLVRRALDGSPPTGCCRTGTPNRCICLDRSLA